MSRIPDRYHDTILDISTRIISDHLERHINTTVILTNLLNLFKQNIVQRRFVMIDSILSMVGSEYKYFVEVGLIDAAKCHDIQMVIFFIMKGATDFKSAISAILLTSTHPSLLKQRHVIYTILNQLACIMSRMGTNVQ